ncbi:hypothetical protein [Methylocapsa palsarum]
MNIVLIWMQDMEIHVHLILGAVLASILGSVIFLTAELDNPFRGEVSVGPDAITLVYETLMKPDNTSISVEGARLDARAINGRGEAPSFNGANETQRNKSPPTRGHKRD